MLQGNGGVYQKPISFLGIMDKNDKVLYDAHANQDRRQVYNLHRMADGGHHGKQVVTDGTGRPPGFRTDGGRQPAPTPTRSGVFFSGLTGWYSAGIRLRDNYKAPSSKPPWATPPPSRQTFMAKIHQDKSLQNRTSWTPRGRESYGLTKVTTCAVSGQLATDVRRHDAMGYGSNGLHAREAVPQVPCQDASECQGVHRQQHGGGTLLPGGHPGQPGRGGAPVGHPLERFCRHQVRQRSFPSTWGLCVWPWAMQAPAPGPPRPLPRPCTLHAHPRGGLWPGVVTNTLLPDAQNLLIQASSQLKGLAPGNPQYEGLLSAINNLNTVISQNPGIEELANAMGILTQSHGGGED